MATRLLALLALLASCLCASDALPHDLRRRQRLVATSEASDAAEFVVFLTATRSASTSLATDLANHSCSISFNEFFEQKPFDMNGLPEGTESSAIDVIFAKKPCQYVSGGCHGPVWKSRFTNMTSVLTEARTGFCSTHWHECGSTCVVNIKIHGDAPPMIASEAPARLSLTELLGHAGTRSVVSERADVAARECSSNYSEATLDYHSGGTGGADTSEHKEQWMAEHCGETASPGFEAQQHEWYGFVRETLADLHEAYIELSYGDYLTDPNEAKLELQAYAGLVS